MKIANINERFGDHIEFTSVGEMVRSVVACGYTIPEDGLREGRDYELVSSPLDVALAKQFDLADEPNITVDDNGRVECDCDPMPNTNQAGRIFAGTVKEIMERDQRE